MQSDFGLDSGLVASMHGVCKRVDNDLCISDITHLIRPFDIRQASDTLQYTMPCWPEGTVFVSVVDPGVGTSRAACIAETMNGYYVVTPDNGTLTMVEKFHGIESVREIDENTNRYRGSEHVDIFHGRDLFAYCGAKLAAGIIGFEQVGPEYPVTEIVRYELEPYEVDSKGASGVASGDPDNGFGIITTNIPNAEFRDTGIQPGDKVSVEIQLDGATVFSESVLFGRTFGDVPVGDPVLYPEMASCLGLALNQDNFAKECGIEAGKPYTITIRK